MSISEIYRFRADLTSDTALRAEAEAYRAEQATSPEDVVAFAAARGYDFDATELAEFANDARGRELALYEISGEAGEEASGEWPQATAQRASNAGLFLAVFFPAPDRRH